MLTTDVAQHIAGVIIEKLGRNINIMNNQGVIIASGDFKRIGTVHEGALKVLETGQAFSVHGDEYEGSKPGINLPISFNGEQEGVVGITGEPKDIMEFGAIVVTMTELMLQRVAFLDESEWKERLKGFLLDECLKEEPDVHKVIHKAKLLEISFRPPFELMVLNVRKPRDNNGGNWGFYREIPDILKGQDLLYDFVDDEHFVILKANAQETAEAEEMLVKHFQSFYDEVRLGLEDTYQHLSETKERYERIVNALSLGSGQIIHTTDITSLLLLNTTALEERKTYIQMILKLTPELRMTLEVFFENDLNISQTALVLFIHRNTMIYRLDRIASITGKDPRKFLDAWELQSGIWLLRTISEE